MSDTRKNYNQQQQWRLLKNLGKQPNVVILKPDKENGIVLLNRPDCVNKMLTILNDEIKFEKITDIDQLVLTTKHESMQNKALIDFQHENILSTFEYEKLRAIGTNIGKLYGLPKIHRTGIQLRSILSAVGTHNYNLAKFVCAIIRTACIFRLCDY